MEKDIQKLVVQFDNTASVIYSDVFDQLKRSLLKTDRPSNENVYKMNVAKAVFVLKNRLGQAASELLEKNRNLPLYQQLHSKLSVKIEYYLQEFQVKASS